MQRIARCYLAFDRRKGSNPFLESGNEPTNQPTSQPTNPSVSFSIPISLFEKVRYTAFENLLRLPSGATLVGSMVHWPRSRSYFLPSFSPFPFFFFLPSPLRFEKVSCIGRKGKKKEEEKSRRYSYTDCYIEDVSSSRLERENAVARLERRTLQRTR